jgi:hypothetical protein
MLPDTKTPSTPVRPTARRALPGRYVDLMRDGIPTADYHRRGGPAVFGALVRIAMSASQRGWSRTAWADEICRPGNHLHTQLKVKRGKERRRAEVEKTLTDAWNAALRNVRDSPTLSGDDLRAIASERYEEVIELVAHADVDLSDVERAVLLYVARRGAESGFVRVRAPRRAIVEALDGPGLTAVRTAIGGLERSGLLVCVERGLPAGAHAKRRRAAVYEVRPDAYPRPDTSPIPVNRDVVPGDLSSGAPGTGSNGALALNCGAPGPHRLVLESPDGKQELIVDRETAMEIQSVLARRSGKAATPAGRHLRHE